MPPTAESLKSDHRGSATLEFPEKKVEMKRVSFYIPAPVYEDLQQLAAERGESMTGIFRWSLGVAKRIQDELEEGRTVRTHSDNGKDVRELVFNPY